MFLWLGWQASAWRALLALAAVTHRQIGFWKDDLTLWSHATQVTSGNWEAENNLGATLLNEEQADQAISHLRAAESIAPSNPWPSCTSVSMSNRRGPCHRRLSATSK